MSRVLATIVITEPEQPTAPLEVAILNMQQDRPAKMAVAFMLEDLARGIRSTIDRVLNVTEHRTAAEETSAGVATHAARAIAMSDDELIELARSNPAALRSIAGSALTQAPDQAGG